MALATCTIILRCRTRPSLCETAPGIAALVEGSVMALVLELILHSPLHPFAHPSPLAFLTTHSVNKHPSTMNRFDHRFQSGVFSWRSLTSGVNDTNSSTSPIAVGGTTCPPVICAICSSNGRL